MDLCSLSKDKMTKNVTDYHWYPCIRFWIQLFRILYIFIQYYTFELDEESQDLCFIKYVTLHGYQMCSWVCPASHGRFPLWCQGCWRLLQWNWSVFSHLGTSDNILYGVDTNSISHNLLRYNCLVLMPIASILICLNVNANVPFRKLIGIYIGSHQLVSSLGTKMMAFYKFNVQKYAQICGLIDAINHHWWMWPN